MLGLQRSPALVLVHTAPVAQNIMGACMQVWPGMLEHVSAVEPSSLMTGMARSIRESAPHLYPACVRWHTAMDPRSAQQSSAGRRFGW